LKPLVTRSGRRVDDSPKEDGVLSTVAWTLWFFVLLLLTGCVLALEYLWYLTDSGYRFYGLTGLGLFYGVLLWHWVRRARRRAADGHEISRVAGGPRHREQRFKVVVEPTSRRVSPPRAVPSETGGDHQVAEDDGDQGKLDLAEVARRSQEQPPEGVTLASLIQAVEGRSDSAEEVPDVGESEGPRKSPFPDGEEIWPTVRAFGPLASQRRTQVGLDVGQRYIKLVQIVWGPSGPRIANFGCARTPPGVLEDGVILRPQELVKRLRDMLRARGIRGRRVVVAVGGGRVIVRHVKLPRMSPAELEEALRWQSEQYISMPGEEAVVDFHIKDADGEGPEMETMLVGVPRRSVEGYLTAIRRLRRYPCAIEIEAVANYRALEAVAGLNVVEDEAVVIVDLGASSTKIGIYVDGLPLLVRSLEVGLRSLVDVIMRESGQDWARAESLMVAHGVANDSPVFDALQPLVSVLLGDIRRSLEYFMAQYRKRIGGIYLVGGGARLKGFPEALRNHLLASLENRLGGDCRVQPVQLPGKLRVNAGLMQAVDGFGPEFVTALGLALRERS